VKTFLSGPNRFGWEVKTKLQSNPLFSEVNFDSNWYLSGSHLDMAERIHRLFLLG
jgi:hypothetical protein